MSNIDWSKAPEGTTHAPKEFSSWYRNNNGTWYFYHESNRGWVLSECSEEWREVHLIARPAPVWRGPQDGLPPVGKEVDCYRGGETWRRGKVVAHVEDNNCRWYAVVQREDGWSFHSANYTRPIQTDRDKAIDEMVADVKQAFCAQVYGGEVSKIVAEALYDAGYRKGGK